MGLCDCQEGSWNCEGSRPGTEKSSGLPLHLSFLLAFLLQHPSSCLQASTACLAPCDRKQALGKFQSLGGTGPATQQETKSISSLSQFENPKERTLISPAWVRCLALSMQPWEKHLLAGSLSCGQGRRCSEGSAWAGNSPFPLLGHRLCV